MGGKGREVVSGGDEKRGREVKKRARSVNSTCEAKYDGRGCCKRGHIEGCTARSHSTAVVQSSIDVCVASARRQKGSS